MPAAPHYPSDEPTRDDGLVDIGDIVDSILGGRDRPSRSSGA